MIDIREHGGNYGAGKNGLWAVEKLGAKLPSIYQTQIMVSGDSIAINVKGIDEISNTLYYSTGTAQSVISVDANNFVPVTTPLKGLSFTDMFFGANYIYGWYQKTLSIYDYSYNLI